MSNTIGTSPLVWQSVHLPKNGEKSHIYGAPLTDRTATVWTMPVAPPCVYIDKQVGGSGHTNWVRCHSVKTSM